MQSGWLIYRKQDAKQNQSYIDWFINEAEKAGLTLSLIYREDLTVGIINHKRRVLLKNNAVSLPDFAVVRTIEPLLNAHLEALGIEVFNSSAVASVCNDKAWTHHHIQNLRIPMVNTLFCKKEGLGNIPPMTYPLIIKEAEGRGGKQVYYINNKKEWGNCIKSLQTSNIIVQSANVQLGKDIRVFVVGKEIIGAVLRENKEDFRANFKLGGSAALYELHPNERDLVLKVIDYFDFGMVGIDFLISLDGKLLLNEIEDVVGSRTLSAVSDINILERYMSHIKDRLKKRGSSEN